MATQGSLTPLFWVRVPVALLGTWCNGNTLGFGPSIRGSNPFVPVYFEESSNW